MQRSLQTPPRRWGRSRGRRPVGRGVFFRGKCFLPPSLPLPHKGGGNRPRLPPAARASCEHPVQEPGGRGNRAIKPRAEQPEPAAGSVLDAEIIAGAAAVLGPPGAFDALRAFGGDDFVERAPPAESHRRSIGHAGDPPHPPRFDEPPPRTPRKLTRAT